MDENSALKVLKLFKGVPDFKWHSNKNIIPTVAGNWYTYSINPMPNCDEIIKVYSDIFHSKEDESRDTFKIESNGVITHYNQCKSDNHLLPHNILLQVRELKEITYRIAIWDNPYDELKGQALFFVLDPEVNLYRYMNHRHINTAGRSKKDLDFLIPESICYMSEFNELIGLTKDERIDYAFPRVALWLLKHQLWLKLNETKYNGNTWIGREHDRNEDDFRRYFRNEYLENLLTRAHINQMQKLKKMIE